MMDFSPDDLGNNFVMVTGSARRIGRAIALEAAMSGWHVVLHHKASHDEAEKLAAEIRALGRHAILVTADLTDAKAVSGLIPSVIGQVEFLNGTLRGLVNNASLFLDNEDDPKGLVLRAIHVAAPTILVEDLYRFLPKGHVGSVVNMLDGTPSPPSFSNYAASKASLREATHTMAKHYAPSLRINGVEPGPTVKSPNESDEHFKSMIDKTLLRHPSKAEDIARAVVFLLNNSSITNERLHVNCGMSPHSNGNG